ncbi:MAG: hypothetical protein KAX99_03670, partial [Azonexus sp.]|nr:hypothetical protein [Azonexus sp.]
MAYLLSLEDAAPVVSGIREQSYLLRRCEQAKIAVYNLASYTKRAMPLNKRRFLTHAAIALAIAAIFAIDMRTPLGLGVPFLYLLLALFAIWEGADNRALMAIAILGPTLAAIKLLAPPPNGVTWLGEANRLIFSLLIWAVVGLEWVRRRLEAGRL